MFVPESSRHFHIAHFLSANHRSHFMFTKRAQHTWATTMWVDAQHDGRRAEYNSIPRTTPQTLAGATARVPWTCSNPSNIGERKTWTQSGFCSCCPVTEFCRVQNSVWVLQVLRSPIGSVTARHSSSGREPNFAALSIGHHLYSAGLPSRWALAHILVLITLFIIARSTACSFNQLKLYVWAFAEVPIFYTLKCLSRPISHAADELTDLHLVLLQKCMHIIRHFWTLKYFSILSTFMVFKLVKLF